MMSNDESIIDLAKNIGMSPQQQATPQNPLKGNVPEEGDDMEMLSKLLANVKPLNERWVEVRLPSNGIAYDAVVKVRPFNFEEEVALKSRIGKEDPSKVIQDIIGNCVEGVDIWKVYVPDRDFLLFKIRELTYGSEYPIEAQCKSCGKLNKLKLDLATLPVNYADKIDKISEVVLPDSKVKALYRLPVCMDSEFISELGSRYKNMARFIASLEIDGTTITDQKIIVEFIRKTTAKDIDTLNNHIYQDSFGLENEVFFPCAGCNADNKTILGMNAHFFTTS